MYQLYLLCQRSQLFNANHYPGELIAWFVSNDAFGLGPCCSFSLDGSLDLEIFTGKEWPIGVVDVGV